MKITRILAVLAGCFVLASIVLVIIFAIRKESGAVPTPEPAEVLSVELGNVPTETGPRIVAQDPIAGARLPLRPVLEFTFDRDMDPRSTEAAWTFEDENAQLVPGQLSWTDARTLRFVPESPLEPASRYTARIAASAKAVDGSSPVDTLVLEFRTVDPLAVGQVFPADDAGDVDPASTITVIFNRPVIPLTIVEEQESLPQPLTLQPVVPGKGEWVSSSVYVFTPDTALTSGTAYHARVAAGLPDSSGGSLAGDMEWTFSTRAPQIVSYSMKNGEHIKGGSASDVLLDQAFTVQFLQPMDPVSVASAVQITDRTTGKVYPTRLTWNKDFTLLTVEPVGRYAVGGTYGFLLADSTSAADGGRLESGVSFVFQTVGMPRVVKTNPSNGAVLSDYRSGVSIQFNTPMNFNSLKNRITVSPTPSKTLTWYYNEYSWTLSAYGLEAGTQYTVRLAPGAADIYGHTIASEYLFSFRNGDLRPYGWIPSPYAPLVYRADGPQNFFFEYTNLTSVKIDLYSIDASEFGDFQANLDSRDFSPQAAPLRTWMPALQAEKNQLVRMKFTLGESEDDPLPPGYYFLGLKTGPRGDSRHKFDQGELFVVATDSFTLKSTQTEALAWLIDLETGKPDPGVPVVFYNEDFQPVGYATTGEDGVAIKESVSSQAQYVATASTDRVAFTSLGWGSGVSPSDFGIWSSYYEEPSARFGYVYTERPLYRPGQDVYFTGVVRADDDLHYSLPEFDRVYVTIENDEEEIFGEYLDLSPTGSFTGTYTLGEEVPLGTYVIRLQTYPDGETFSAVSFRVAEYRKPEFQVGVTAEPDGILPDGEVTFRLAAEYYSGGSVANADVDWFLESSPFYYQPPKEFQRYSFQDWDQDSYSTPAAGISVVADGQAVTGADGRLELTQIVSPGKTGLSRTLTFSANVTDVAGNLVSGGTQLVLHQSLYYAGIRSASYIGRSGQEQTFQLAVLDWDGNPAAGRTVNVDVVRREWYSVQEQDEEGRLRWVTSVKDVPAAHFANVAVDADGKAEVLFTPKTGGVYRALVTVRDGQGRTHQASAFLWVSSSEYVAWRQTNDRSLTLVADRDSYEPGDTAEFLIASPFAGESYALVTYERGHIYRHEVIRLEGNSTIYRLPVTADMAPLAYVSVVVVGGGETLGTPDFRVGMARIEVSTSRQTLDVRIVTDKTAAGPGDEVTYTVTTRDADGEPIPAEVSFALVDKAILALAPSNVLPLLDAFYPERALAVRTAVGIVQNAEDFLQNLKETTPTGESAGSGGGGKGEGDLGVITVRQNFKDTAFFRSQILTDEEGKAQVTVTLPENLTTWHMDVRAVTEDSRVGQAANDLVSTKPLIVQLQTPRFFVKGDSVRLGATLLNNTAGSLTVQVALEARGVELQSPAEQTVTVPGKQQAYVTWDVSVQPGAVRVDLTASVSGGGYTDATKPVLATLPGQGIPVYAYSVKETVGTSGMLSDADSVTEAFQLPVTMESQGTALQVDIAPSLAASVTEGFAYLEQYPYLCMEQTISRFLPNVMMSKALQDAGLPDLDRSSDLDVQVSAGLQKIYSTQNYDGGWAWWGGSRSHLQTSAYVVLGLLEARGAGYPVKPSVLNNGIDYLRSNLPALDANAPKWEYNRQAFLLYVLARAGYYPSPQNLYAHRQILGVYGKAFLLQTLAMNEPGDARVTTLLSDIAGDVKLSAAGAHWEEAETDYWNWNTDVRTTAIVLDAMMRVDPKNVLAPSVVRWLMAARTEGRWSSTQETAWSLMALVRWLTVSQEFQTDYAYAVGLNGELVASGRADQSNLSQSTHLDLTLESSAIDLLQYLVITRGDGPGNLYYTAYMENELPVEAVQPLDQGVIVTRQYFTLDDSKNPITSIGRGELVRVRLTLVVPEAVHYLIVNDPLPAGLEPLDASLETGTAVPDKYSREEYNLRGWGWWYFPHKEIRDEKVVLSADYLPPGTYVYTYLARAGTAGTFRVIPATAEEFYFPDVGGRSAGSLFTVKP